MSITVKDCLTLPSLSMGKVVAGAKGLDGIVNTVSVLEFDDDDDIFIPNDLLISSLYIAKDDVDWQCSIIERSKANGDVGLVLFYADVILNGLNPRLIETADKLNYPLILLPEKDFGLKYSDVITDVMELIIADKKTYHFFVNDTLERISQLPETERNISNVLSFASNYTKSSLFLYDDQHMISSYYWPAGNTHDLELLEHYLAGSAIIDADHRGMFKSTFTYKDDSTMTLYGISHYNVLTQQKMSECVEIIQLFSSVWNYNLRFTTKESLIPALFNGDTSLISSLTSKTGFPVSKINSVMIVRFDSTPVNNEMLFALKEKVLILFSDLASKSIIDVFNQYLVVMTTSSYNKTLKTISLEALEDLLNGCGQNYHCAYYNNISSTDEIHDNYIQFCNSFEVAVKLYPQEKYFSSWQLGFAEECHDLQSHSKQDTARHYRSLLDPLKESKQDDLLPTLSTYLLDANSEIKKTSELLFVHRNTILYRLNKVKSLLNADFTKMPFLYSVYLAVALERVSG